MNKNAHLIIGPSQQVNNKYINSTLTEEKVMGILGMLINEIGTSKMNTYLVDTGTLQGNINESNRLYDTIKAINPNATIIHLDIHSNAFNGKSRGCLGLYISTEGKKLMEFVQGEVAKLTPVTDEGIRKGEGLIALTKTKAIAGLIEVSYHDNEEDKLFILKNLYSFAMAIVDGVERYLNTKAIKEKPTYKIIGTTHVLEVNPLDLYVEVVKKEGNLIQGDFANGTFFDIAKQISIGTLVKDGKIIAEQLAHDTVKRGCFIVYKDGSVAVEMIDFISKHPKLSDIKFAISGFNMYPLDLKKEWFNPDVVGYSTSRTVLGYNPITNKVIIAIRPNTDAQRGKETLENLGCTMGIGLDSGGSTNGRFNDVVIRQTTRKLHNIIRWG